MGGPLLVRERSMNTAAQEILIERLTLGISDHGAHSPDRRSFRRITSRDNHLTRVPQAPALDTMTSMSDRDIDRGTMGGFDPVRHWDATYDTRGATGVSWYQQQPNVSLELIGEVATNGGSAIDVGGGESLLVDRLLERGFGDVTVLDVSPVALTAARLRVKDSSVTWLHADLCKWRPERTYRVWHDRAVFHFLTTPSDRATYLAALSGGTAPGSTVIIGTFALDGPKSCSGLPVVRYSTATLAAILGERYEVVATREERHVTPSGGVQPFTWLAARVRSDSRTA